MDYTYINYIYQDYAYLDYVCIDLNKNSFYLFKYCLWLNYYDIGGIVLLCGFFVASLCLVHGFLIIVFLLRSFSCFFTLFTILMLSFAISIRFFFIVAIIFVAIIFVAMIF